MLDRVIYFTILHFLDVKAVDGADNVRTNEWGANCFTGFARPKC